MKTDASLTQSAAVLSIVVASILIVIKGFAWADSDSTSVLASFADSSLDIIVSLINFFAIRFAFAPADKEHPFGHGKAESLAALMQSAFIAGSAFVLLLHAGERLLQPQQIQSLGNATAVMAISLTLTILLVLYQRWVYRQTASLAVKADSAHYVGDILANGAVIIALFAAQVGIIWLDPVVALLIVITLLKSAYDIAKESLDMLMDHSLDPEVAEKIKALVAQHPDIIDCHDIKTRQAGNVQFIQVHLDFSAEIPLHVAHDAGEWLVAQILLDYPRADVLIHHDPVTVHAFDQLNA